MNSKFDVLYESNFARFQGGGFLTGDIIKFKEGWASDPWCKQAPQQLVDMLTEFDSSDLVLRVSSVKAIRPTVNSSVDQALGVDDFYLDITQETAPGYYNGNFVTVPQTLVELNGPTDKLPELPDSLKRKDQVDTKPVELTEDDTTGENGENQFETPAKQTGTDDKVNKELSNKDQKLPGATGAASYTAGYLN